MKSLYDTPTIEYSSIFTKEVLDYIKQEGFVFEQKVISYADTKEESSEWGYTKLAGHSDGWPIFIYIRDNHIGVDLDYDCGGNSSNSVFEYNECGGFEKAYNEMVVCVNSLKR